MRLAPLVLVLVAGSAFGQAKPAAAPAPLASRWKVKSDEQGLVASVTAVALEGKPGASADEMPILAVTCDAGKLEVFFYAERWKRADPIAVQLDAQDPVTFYTKVLNYTLYVAPEPFLSRLPGHRRLVASYAPVTPSEEVARFDLAGIDAALHAVAKACPLPTARPPRPPSATRAWAVREQVSAEGQAGVALVRKGLKGSELYVRCRWDAVETFIGIHGSAQLRLVDDTKPLLLRFDEEPEESLPGTRGGQFSAIFLPKPRLSDLMSHQRLRVGYSLLGLAGGQEESFDLAGAKEAIGAYRELCRLPDS